jgi:hypothetical protein
VFAAGSLAEAVGLFTGQLDLTPTAFSWEQAVAAYGRGAGALAAGAAAAVPTRITATANVPATKSANLLGRTICSSRGVPVSSGVIHTR